ncbi:MAG: tyrosine recombinase [Anaerolineae bacterium]|nr:tyrosine recombinase [Anaerolineae bacterium]
MKDRIQGFLDFLKIEKGYADNTIAAYQNDLNQFYQHIHAGDSNLADWAKVKKKAVIAYIDALKNGGDYASSTVARKVAAIKSFFHFLVAEGDLSEDPTVALEPPKVKKRLPKAISPTEIERLLHAPAGQTGPKAQRDLALLEMLYASGMRVTELVSLNVADIDFAGQNSKVRVKGKRSNAKEREIPIVGDALNVLKTYVENGREQLLQDPNEGAVFLNNRGQRLTRQGLWLIIKYYVDAVGISAEVTPHTLRHSFAAHKLSQGKSLQDIQKLLGHANISTTQVYTHLNQESEKAQ